MLSASSPIQIGPARGDSRAGSVSRLVRFSARGTQGIEAGEELLAFHDPREPLDPEILQVVWASVGFSLLFIAVDDLVFARW